MAQYRTLKMGFWSDTYVERLTPSAKLLYLYLISSEHTDNLGVLTITRRKMAYETGLPESEVDKLIEGFIQDGKILHEGESILLINFIKNQTSTSKLVISGLQSLFNQLEIRSFRERLLSKYRFLKASDMDLNHIEPPSTHTTPSDTLSNHIEPCQTVSIPCQEFEVEREVEVEREREEEKEGGFSDEETPSDESLPDGVSDSAPPSPSCPIRKIVEIYHEKCPALPRVKAMHKAREEMLRTRWREDEDRQNLDFWGAFFSSVAASDFLCGRATPKPGKAPFVADFEWLIRPQNFAKVLEGKYDTESKVAPDIPYDDIMRLWNSIVAASGKKPGISEMHSLRKAAVARIWNGVPSWGKVESWEKFFVWLSRYPGFMDLKNCGFDWLLQYDNFVKVREATYGA